MWLILLRENWKGLLLLVLIVLLSFKLHSCGVGQGRAEIQSAWDKQKAANLAEINRIKEENRTKEAEHRAENERIYNDLFKAERQHAVALSEQRAEFDRRLRSSEARAAKYKALSEAGPTERADLASYAARLDTSLEEGRDLVREFRETLGLRDRQIESLRDQINNDRKLINGTESSAQ